MVVRESNPVAAANWLLDHGARVVIASKKDDAAAKRIEEHLKRIARDGASYEHLRARLTWEPNAKNSNIALEDIFFSEWKKKVIAIMGRHGKTMAALWAGHLIGDAVVTGHTPERPPVLALDSRAKVAIVEVHDTVPDAKNIHVVNTDTMSARDAAVQAAQLAGVHKSIIQKRLATLPQIPRRQEVVRESAKLTLVDDTMATIPDRGVAAVQRFGGPTCILIAGGDGGKLNCRAWASTVQSFIRPTNLILMEGSATKHLRAALGAWGRGIRAYDSPERCWKEAHARASKYISATILFSPAAKTSKE